MTDASDMVFGGKSMKCAGPVGKWKWAWLGAAMCGSVLADPRLATDGAAASQPAPVVAEPPLQLSLGGASGGWAQRAALDLKRVEQKQLSGLSVVELPPEGVPGARTRPRHALSVSSEYPKLMLRSMGIDATDCATRFRVPTKLKRDAEGGSNIEVRADLGLACRF
jgi:hypothetical protein